MALLSRKEFAEACLIDHRSLAVYITRKKVVLTGDKIDTEVNENKYFLEHRREFAKKKNPSVVIEPEIELNNRVIEQQKQEPQTQFEFPKEYDGTVSENFQLDSKMKRTAADKAEIERDILQAKRMKLLGESIPTSLVKDLLLQHTKSIVSAFKNAGETLIIKISKIKSLSLEEKATLRAELIQITNAASEEALKNSKNSVTQIVEDYSMSREVGERS